MSISRRLDRLERLIEPEPEPQGEPGDHQALRIVLSFHLGQHHPEIVDAIHEIELKGNRDPAIRQWVDDRLDSFVSCIREKRRCTCGVDDIVGDWQERTGGRLTASAR